MVEQAEGSSLLPHPGSLPCQAGKLGKAFYEHGEARGTRRAEATAVSPLPTTQLRLLCSWLQSARRSLSAPSLVQPQLATDQRGSFMGRPLKSRLE